MLHRKDILQEVQVRSVNMPYIGRFRQQRAVCLRSGSIRRLRTADVFTPDLRKAPSMPKLQLHIRTIILTWSLTTDISQRAVFYKHFMSYPILHSRILQEAAP